MNVPQGVTLTDLKEAQRTTNLSSQDRQIEEGGALEERAYLRKGWTDNTGATTIEGVETKSSVTDEVSKRNSCKRQFPVAKSKDVSESSLSSVCLFSIMDSRETSGLN